jgi:gas vesicle protein GvpA/GvpJ/GvpM family
MALDLPPSHHRSTGLVDVLDRVLDKGLLVAGDIRVSLAEVELLTIRIRLIVCSMDKAQEMGLDWWKHDPHLSSDKRALASENETLRQRIRALERQVAGQPAMPGLPPSPRRPRPPRSAPSRTRTRGG